MSRSIRRTPIFAMTAASSEKLDKAAGNRRWRAAVRRSLRQQVEVMPHQRDHTDPATMAKDGKCWMGIWARGTPRAMRK